MNVEIAQRLAELRREKGYSQEELAERLGLSRQAVSKWERAESSPDTGNLVALAKLYGVTLDELLRFDEDLEDDIIYEAQDRNASAEEKAQAAAEKASVAAAQAAAAAAQAQAAQTAAKAVQDQQAYAAASQTAQPAQAPQGAPQPHPAQTAAYAAPRTIPPRHHRLRAPTRRVRASRPSLPISILLEAKSGRTPTSSVKCATPLATLTTAAIARARGRAFPTRSCA
ncbi:helix-turn-helix transcriptional regulator [Raoultibacter timonensis]|nr:helix-turn-helix transcriptional regulator [Raoultibacter timonensis]